MCGCGGVGGCGGEVGCGGVGSCGVIQVDKSGGRMLQKLE